MPPTDAPDGAPSGAEASSARRRPTGATGATGAGDSSARTRKGTGGSSAQRRAGTAGSQAPRPRRRWLWILGVAIEAGTIACALGALLLWCSVPSTAKLRTENPTSTAFIDLRREQADAARRRFDLKWDWRPIGQISRYLRAAVVYAEDYKFYRHEGIDWGGVRHAVESNLDRGTFSIGGSTITQQLAKNLYLSPDKSLIRKAREMLIAFSLEDNLPKQRILELYLNVVEWGDGVFGAEAAARHWFGHSAQALTPAEAVKLAVALPNPLTRAPNQRHERLTRKAVRLVRMLRMQGLIDADQERAALDQVGAPNERVLPSRGKRPSGQPEGGPTAPPVPGAPPPGEPAAPTPEPAVPTPEPAAPTPEPAPEPAE